MIPEKALLVTIEHALGTLPYPQSPSSLYEPVAYTLDSGGKRLRPLLALMTAAALGADPATALHQAVAMEMFHNFTLIHDDVMDRSATRHGRPSVYASRGAVQAILSGDALLSMAVSELAAEAGDRLAAALDLFGRVSQGVYQGQQYDMEFEERTDVTLAEYMHMIELKTSVLIGGSCAMGALMAGAGADVQTAMYDYGVALGLAFQLRDDWLDTYGDPAVFGKPIGGDIANGKKTWLHLRACELDPAAMASATAITDRDARIEAVRAVYDRLGIGDLCTQACDSLSEQAVGSLAAAGLTEEYAEWFAALARRLATRDR